ncbi:MAG TPA: hypothetical protein PK950_01800 [Candidatus Paceibacterota bacterium]|nr:hypothetical protein [Candidatus Paceibacterota bacterium]
MKNNKPTGITYDELMNSRFLEFPGHNEALYKIFSTIGAVLIIAAASIASGIMLQRDAGIITLTTLFSLMLLMKMQYSFTHISGHGVGIVRKSKFSILGAPKKLSISFVILFVLTLFMVSLSFAGDFSFDDTQLNFQYLSSCLFFAVIILMLNWRLYAYYTTWHGDEYAARVYFTKKGFSSSTIQECIDTLKLKGILSSRK